MKAIIIAAGKGSRLKDLTKETPKCLLHVGGKPIIKHQIDAFAANGITDVGIIKGYLAHWIQYPEFRTFLNTDYENNNILCSLMTAEEFMDEDMIISYSDIVYSPETVLKLLESSEDISIVVDMNWRIKYEGRTLHPESEAEKVLVNTSSFAKKLGKVIRDGEGQTGEFIGLFKISKRALGTFREAFHEAKEAYAHKPFINAKTFEKAYITDFIHYLISRGQKVHCTLISDGWREIDTEQDLFEANQWIKTVK